MITQTKAALATVSAQALEFMNSVFDMVLPMFNLSTEAAERIRSNPIARRFAVAPYLAGCRDADRCAIHNLSVYIIASKAGPCHKAFDHRPTDNSAPMARVMDAMMFLGGDQDVINQIMLREVGSHLYQLYHRDCEKDAKSGEYNALNAGAFEINAVLDSFAEYPVVIDTQELGIVTVNNWWF